MDRLLVVGGGGGGGQRVCWPLQNYWGCRHPAPTLPTPMFYHIISDLWNYLSYFWSFPHAVSFVWGIFKMC